MSAVNDIMQLTQRTAFLGQTLTNVFHYRIVGVGTGSPAAENLVTAFGDEIIPKLADILATTAQLGTAYCLNLADLSDWFIHDFNFDGTVSSTGLSSAQSFVAAKFTYRRNLIGGRNGYKRFGGLSEASVGGNAWTAALTAPDALAAALFADLGGAGYDGWLFRPVVASRPIVYGTNPSTYDPQGVDFSGVTSQASRRVVSA